MRRTIALSLTSGLMASGLLTGAACASSFVAIAPPLANARSSIIFVGEPVARTAETSGQVVLAQASPAAGPQARGETSQFLVPLAYPLPQDGIQVYKVSPSIIAFDSSIPNVTYEQVAAIAPSRSRSRPVSTPVVMRAGVLGDSGPAAVTPVAVASPAPSGQGGSGAASQKSSRRGKQPEQPPAPAPLAPPPPTLPRAGSIE